MIKVLHIYPKDDHSTARYVALLSKALPDSFESKCFDDLASLKKMCRDWQPDIVHQYGVLSVDVPDRRVVSPCGNAFDNLELTASLNGEDIVFAIDNASRRRGKGTMVRMRNG